MRCYPLCGGSAVQRRRDQFLGSVWSLCLLMHRHCHKAPFVVTKRSVLRDCMGLTLVILMAPCCESGREGCAEVPLDAEGKDVLTPRLHF